MPDQTGRRAIVTGANSGIGYITALELARHGAVVVIASRSAEKGTAAASRINQAVGQPRAEFAPLDLASLASVRAFATRELARNAPLDLLINNAGVYAPPKRRESTDGFELQFGTNVLGHFALTGLLLPALTRAAAARPAIPPRVVTIASIAHKSARLHFENLQFQGHYRPQAAYGQSKLANLMLALDLDRRLRAAGSPILSVAAHPGVASTALFLRPEAPAFERTMRTLFGHLIDAALNSVPGGALPTLFAATRPGRQPRRLLRPTRLRRNPRRRCRPRENFAPGPRRGSRQAPLVHRRRPHGCPLPRLSAVSRPPRRYRHTTRTSASAFASSRSSSTPPFSLVSTAGPSALRRFISFTCATVGYAGLPIAL